MFSNQYMGTRFASRSLPRPTNISGPYGQPSHGRLYSYEVPSKPVNARPSAADEDESVDYSFMNLPVRERRKMFLGGMSERPFGYQAGRYQSMTVPRFRNSTRQPTGKLETQSEYGGGDYPFGWEPSVVPTMSTDARSAPTSFDRKTSSTRTIVLNTPCTYQPVEQPIETPTYQSSQFTAKPVSPSLSEQRRQFGTGRSYLERPQAPSGTAYHEPQYSTTLHVHDPYYAGSQSRIVNNATVRVYPSRRFGSVVGYPRTTHGYNNSGDAWKTSSVAIPGRFVQPLRVNVYNSDASTAQFSPERRTINSRVAVSPLYAAYPANIEKSFVLDTQSPRDRFRRGHSVQPVIIHPANSSPVLRKTESQQYWKPLQAPNWMEPSRVQRQGRYISITKPIAGRARKQEPQEPPGISEF